MNEVENLKRNKLIKDAIDKARKSEDEKDIQTVMSAVLQMMHEDGSLLVPVVINKDDDGPSFSFRVLENKDGVRYLPAFTDFYEVERGRKIGVLPMGVRDIVREFLGLDDIDDLIINPWGDNFSITKTGAKNLKEAEDHICMDQRGIIFDPNDITGLDCEVIVNSADPLFADGGGVDHDIYEAAGQELMPLLDNLESVKLAEVKVTPSFNMPSRYIYHTVGPVFSGEEEDKDKLADCYMNCLDEAKKMDVRSIAFPAISTGESGFPPKPAASVAILTATEWLNKNSDYGMRIIFSLPDKVMLETYKGFIEYCKQQNS